MTEQIKQNKYHNVHIYLIQGTGFGDDATLVSVTMGEAECTVETIQDNKIECITESKTVAHTVTNEGAHPVYGKYYMWSPPLIVVEVGNCFFFKLINI